MRQWLDEPLKKVDNHLLFFDEGRKSKGIIGLPL